MFTTDFLGMAASQPAATQYATMGSNPSNLFAGLDSSTGMYSGGSTGYANVSMPLAPTLFTGGNLVQSVNATYAPDFKQKQLAYSTASNAIQSTQQTIANRQKDIPELQKKWEAEDTECKLWESRHKGCGPGWFYDYSCGECDDKSQAARRRADGYLGQIKAINDFVQEQQNQISSYLQPQLNNAGKELQASYDGYRKDIAAAQETEKKSSEALSGAQASAQDTLNMNNPAYWLKLQKDAQDKAAADLAQSKADNKSTLIKIGIIAISLIAVAAIVLLIVKKSKAN